MKVLTITLGGQSYSTGKITAYLSREALKVQSEAVKVAKRGLELQKDVTDVDAAGQLLEDILALRDKKSWLLCQVYGDQFTLEELESQFDDEEIDAEVNRIISGISGVVTKN
jgi:hypothetical protein